MGKQRHLNWIPQLLIFIVLAFVLTGCGAKQPTAEQGLQIEPAKMPVSEYVRPDGKYVLDKVADPWEPFNRRMYKFNYHFDRYVFLPIVHGYEAIMPDLLEQGVSNFFNNLSEIRNLINCILQLKGKGIVDTTGRFLINTTVGIGGLFDHATGIGIYEHKEDFGQTLGHYGAGFGPYLVLPILGPSSLRDGAGLAVDTAIRYAIYNEIDPFEHAERKDEIELGINLLQAVDKRHQVKFRYYETGSPFEYELVRLLYYEKRELDIDK